MTKWLSILLFVAPLAQASPTTFYFLGTMYINNVETGAVKKSEYLLARTIDIDKNEIREVMTSKAGEAPYSDTSSVMKVGQRSIEGSAATSRFVERLVVSDTQAVVRHVDVYRVLDETGGQILSEQIDIVATGVPDYVYLLGRQKIYGKL